MFLLRELHKCRLRLKCDGTRAETRIRLSAKRTSLFKSAGASVQSTTGSRAVRISGSNAGYTMFRGSVKGTGYPLHSSRSPFTSPPVRHRVPSHFNWTLSHSHRFLAVFDHCRRFAHFNVSAYRVFDRPVLHPPNLTSQTDVVCDHPRSSVLPTWPTHFHLRMLSHYHDILRDGFLSYSSNRPSVAP